MQRRSLAVLIGLCAAAALGLVWALDVGGGAAPLVLADPGAAVRWGTPVIALCATLASAVTIGALVLAAWAIPVPSAGYRRALAVASIAAVIWTLAAVAILLLSYVELAPGTLSGAGGGERLWFYATQVSLGQSQAWTIGIAALTAVFVAGARSIKLIGVLAVLAMAGLVPLALSGHAAGTAQHNLAVGALLIHLEGASVWVGGLIVLFLVWAKLGESLHVVVLRYSSLALAAFIAVAGSGILSAAVRVPHIRMLVSAYGAILAAKAVGLIVLGVFGAFYRVRVLRLHQPLWRFVAVELVVMGAVSGLAVALARTAPPASVGAQPVVTPASILTGEPLPPPFTVVRLFTEYRLDPIWLLVAGFGVFFYAAGVRRLKQRGDAWPVSRLVLWIAGMAVLVFVTNSGMNKYQEILFSAHMTSHMVLSMVIPLLLVPAAPITLSMRAIHSRHDGSWGSREWILWAVHTPYGRFIASPVVAAVVFVGSLLAFYYTPLFEWSTRTHLGHEWMIVHFLIAGYLFVQSLIGVDPGPKPSSYPFGLLILLGTMAFHAFFGVGLMMGTGLLQADWFGAMGRTWGPSPLADQQDGGGVAWAVGEVPTVVLAIIVAVSWSRSDERLSKRLDRREATTGDAQLNAYNAMLARLTDGDGDRDGDGGSDGDGPDAGSHRVQADRPVAVDGDREVDHERHG